MLYLEPLEACEPGLELILPTLWPELLVFYCVCVPNISIPAPLVVAPLDFVPSFFLLLILMADPP